MVTEVLAGNIDVTLFDASVAAPLVLAPAEVAANPLTGPIPAGHTSNTVGVKHNCGASPIALTRALALSGPEAP